MFVYKVAVIGPTAAGRELAGVLAAAGMAVTTDLAEAGDADLVVEAAEDSFEDKQALLSEIDAAVAGHAVLATTTEQWPVTELADATGRPHLVVGLHAAGPAHLEVVEGMETASETAQAVADLVAAAGRTPVRCADTPGFLFDRLAEADDPLAEACHMLQEGVGGLRDLDVASGGAFTAADATGLDAALAGMEDPPLLLRRLVAQGRTGRAAGQGFFPYPSARVDDIAVAWLGADPVAALRGPGRAVVLASADPAAFWTGTLDPGLLQAVEDAPVPVVAAVNGPALGGGCDLAAACDVRLAASSATFGSPAPTPRLGRLVGTGKALEMALTGASVPADEAFQHGLVNRVVADHELFDVACSWARRLADAPPGVLRAAREAVR